MSQQPAMPECNKMLAVKDQSQIIGEFIEWLHSQGFVIASWGEGGVEDMLWEETNTIEEWLAMFCGIDLSKVEQERRALLEWLREGGNEPTTDNA